MFLTRLLLFQTPCSYFAVPSEKFPEIFLFVIDVVLLEVSVTIPEDLVLAVHAVVVPLALVDVSFTRVILFIDRNRVVHTLPLVNLLGSYEKMHWPSLYLLTYLMLSYRVSNTVSILAVIFPVALENFAEGVVELALAVGAVVNIIALVDVFVEVNESVVSVGYVVPLVDLVVQPVDPNLLTPQKWFVFPELGEEDAVLFLLVRINDRYMPELRDVPIECKAEQRILLGLDISAYIGHHLFQRHNFWISLHVDIPLLLGIGEL